MGQIIGSAAKPKRCNIQSLSSLGTPAAGEYILVSSDNSMNAAGQGNFDCYIVGDNSHLATELPLFPIANGQITKNGKQSVAGSAVWNELNESREVLASGTTSSGSYLNGNGSIGSLTAYSLKLISVSAGEEYRIVGQSLAGSSRRYAVYSSETPSSDSLLYITPTSMSATPSYDETITIPTGGVLLVCAFMSTNPSSVVVYQEFSANRITRAEDNISDIKDTLYYAKQTPSDYTNDEGKYIGSTGNIATLYAYSLKLVSVNAGETYRIVASGMTGSTKTYGIYNSSELGPSTNLAVGDGVGSGSYDILVTIPAGATILAVVYMTGNPTSSIPYKVSEAARTEDIDVLSELAEDTLMYCKISSQAITWAFRTNNKCIKATMQPTGGNGLFDFSAFGVRTNINISLSDLISDYTPMTIATTDWHAPFVVSAINNIDGDNLDGNNNYNAYFTGGNHQYNNTGSGSTATARLASLTFCVDGKNVTEFAGKCDNIDITWVNLVQGYNTTKADGSGREILKETHVMSIRNGVIKERVLLTPLEDVKVMTWYGIQCYMRDVNYIEFVGAENRSSTVSSSVNSISTQCREMKVKNSYYAISLLIDETLDLGKREYVTLTGYTAGAFRSSDKYYNRIIYTRSADAVLLTANNNYYLDCGFKFE